MNPVDMFIMENNVVIGWQDGTCKENQVSVDAQQQLKSSLF